MMRDKSCVIGLEWIPREKGEEEIYATQHSRYKWVTAALIKLYRDKKKWCDAWRNERATRNALIIG